LKDKKGLTLIEVLIALVVLLLVFLALMQTALLSIDANMVNVLRDEAFNIAEMRMNEARNTQFDNLLEGTTDVSPPPRNLRNITGFTFTANRTVTNINSDNKQVDINITWDWKEKTAENGDPYTHSLRMIMRRR